MAPGCLKDCHIIALTPTSYIASWTTQKVKTWVESAGGHVTFKEDLTEQTTHVVMNEDTWREQGPFIQKIFKAETKDTEEEDDRAIHIVSFDWLGACIEDRVKRRESKFKWKKLASEVLKRDSEGREPGNHQGLMNQTFMDSTDNFVNAVDKKRIEQRKRREADDRVEELDDQQRAFRVHKTKMGIPEQAAVFRKGAKRARVDLLSDNHHIYLDETGFPFDVTITKVDFNNNANERYVLTIYETNSDSPHYYAFHCRFAGTKVLPSNKIIAALGSNFPTAFRAFKKTFKEHTGIAWDDRLIEYNKREAKIAAGEVEEVSFEKQKFEYCPPKYGPIGELPLDQVETSVALVQAFEEEKKIFRPSPVVDDWEMSGANGSRDDGSASFKEFMASSAKEMGFPSDDQLIDSPLEYPFSPTGSGEKEAIVVEDDDDEGDPTPISYKQNSSGNNNIDLTEESSIVGEEAETSSQNDNIVSQQTETPSYQQPQETYEFDESLDLTQSFDFDEMPIGSSQDPSQPAYTAQNQFGQTQLTENVRAGLLLGESTQFAAGGDDMDSQASTVKKTKTENNEFRSRAQGDVGKAGEAIDLGLGSI